MEKPVKYLLIIILGLAVILGASGFSFIVHHCFTSENTEVSTKGGHTDNCCHHPNHGHTTSEGNCCNEENKSETQKPFTEISHKCCEEGLLAVQGLPLYNKTNVPEISAELLTVFSFIYQISVFPDEKTGTFSFGIPPPKFSGKQILLLHQVFLL